MLWTKEGLWDADSSMPDIFLGIQKGLEIDYFFISNELYNDASSDQFTFEDGLSIEIKSQRESYRFSLVDLDEEGYQEVFWCTALLYHSKNGLPDVYEYEFEKGETIKVWLEYEF